MLEVLSFTLKTNTLGGYCHVRGLMTLVELLGIPFVFGFVLYWWLRWDFRYAIPLGVVVGVVFMWLSLGYARISMIAMAFAPMASALLGNVSAELVTRFRQGEMISNQMKLRAALATAGMLGSLFWLLAELK